ncbi:MAG: tRNA 4-thiouridine(8) synthase ThiI, partial [Lachnospiraceae bacterium]|nr:tRNA 4-thiouridine(8) synthase ThiI [Lachnospiraceae bacterium]
MQKGILIKYGEIVLKGNNRVQFENRLIKDIRIALKEKGRPSISKEQGRLFIQAPEGAGEEWTEEITERLTKVFGIIGICPVDVLDDDRIETLCSGAVEYVKREFDRPCTFKVIARRADKHYPMNSMEIGAKVGEAVLYGVEGWKVDVNDPQVKLFVELRSRVYVYGKEVKGLGGLPVGTGGKATLLLSGGIDSPVAGWMMAKRGIQLSAVYFHAHPFTSDRAKEKVLELARLLTPWCGHMVVHVVPFTAIQEELRRSCPEELFTIIMRRFMMRIAQSVARRCGAGALVTGESLGQVASQTM